MVLWSNAPCIRSGGRGFKSRRRHFFWMSAVSHGLVPRVKSQLRKMEARQLTRWWFESTILRGDEDEYVIWINSKLPEVWNSRESSWDIVIIVTRMKSTKKEDGSLCKKKWLNGYTTDPEKTKTWKCRIKKNANFFEKMPKIENAKFFRIYKQSPIFSSVT